ncbi:hypothetical protein IAG25_40200 [Caballeronia sp. EK]|uniref:hypothetical protein n=1 Tax=Caballeronia sp. EK TaxID=2767469 RepID=UPI0016562F0C|nr:hypothetical protein [Caballeronia sp. EK]MBC8642977.1 hypothetical protein [Caballeronia sp. EK]
MNDSSPKSPLAHLMQDMQKRQEELGARLKEFEGLRQEILQLQERAPHDAQARQRLDRLSQFIQGEFVPLNEKLQKHAEKLNGELQKLEASFRGTADQGSGSTQQTRTSTRTRRTFI